MRLARVVLLALAALFVFGAGPAAATELVDDDHAQCPTATHTTIQAGVNAASPGEQVLVCNGLYREQVVIAGPGKNGVDVNAKSVHGATIKAPSTPLAAPESLVYINNASNVKVRRFIIAGPGPGTADSLRHGVLVENNADPGELPAQVLGNQIEDIRDSQAAANEEGIGVRVGRNYAGTKGRATVDGNLIQRYQKGGVVVDGDGSYGLVTRNTIRGLGLLTSSTSPPPAQQGIQVGRNAAAEVNTNSISNNLYAPDNSPDPQFNSFGIFIFNTDRLTPSGKKSRVKTNRVFDNDVGIYLQDAKNQLVETNTIFSNGDTSTAAPDGGLAVAETGAGLGGSNVFNRNDARNNEGKDCEDDTTGGGTLGTGNTWTGNRGTDNVPAGICTP